MKRIVVGMDGSPTGEAALRWALGEAAVHDGSVTAVMAWSYLEQHHADGSEDFDPAYGEDDAREALRASVERASPAGHVEQRTICDLPVDALVSASATADLLVVGARGLGGFKGLLLGSVSEQVLQHSACPVAVVRAGAETPTNGPVVVGIDSSERSLEAMRWAAAEATARQATLHVVHAWDVPALAMPVTTGVLSALRGNAQAVLDAALSDPALADTKVEGHLPCMGAAQAILECAADASLLVIGSRGAGRLRRTLLGSTSRQLAHHATCPIVVVRHENTPPEPGDTG
jgi:nucleotide-binding universal stress UspA family protein